MSMILEFIQPYLAWLALAAAGLVALFATGRKIRSDGKAEGVHQERAKQVEAARKETTVAVETRNEAQAAPQATINEKFSKYVRPRK